MKKIISLCVMSLASAGVFSQESAASSAALYAISLFGEGCFKTSGKPEEVSAWAKKAGLTELSETDRKSFLAGRSGKAWAPDNTAGNFVISVADNGFCTVYAYKVNAQALKELYLGFLPGPATKLTVEKKIDGVKKTPKGDLYTLAHEIGQPEAPFRITTALSTSDNDQAPMQGILSLSVTPK